MESENNFMRSKFLQENNELEYVFYNNKNSFEVNTESEAKRIFSELIQLTCILKLKIRSLISK